MNKSLHISLAMNTLFGRDGGGMDIIGLGESERCTRIVCLDFVRG
jgi:hypothetical protein